MIENRKDYRIPFRSKFVFATEDRVATGNALNVSAGGIFIMALNPFPRDTPVRCLFSLQRDESPMVIDGIVRRVVVPSANPEETPGCGLEFERGDPNLERIREFMEESRRNYEVAATILSSAEPDLSSLRPLLAKIHTPTFEDLGALRFYVERILRSIELVDRTMAQRRGQPIPFKAD